MNQFRILVPFLCFGLAMCSLAVYSKEDNSANASELAYYTEIYPPSNYLVDNKLTGMSVELLKLMWKEMEVSEQPIQIVPWPRGYKLTRNQKNSVLFTMSRTPKRENLFKWVGPIFTASHVLLAKADFKHEINTVEDAYPYLIAAKKEDISEIALIEAGFPKENIAPLVDLGQSVIMLDNGKLDLIIVSQASILDMVESSDLTMDKFKIVYTLNQEENYFAFHLSTPDTLINKFQNALDGVEKDRKILLSKYKLEIN